MDFGDVIGHDRIIRHLQHSILMDKTSHAYIFNGEDGCGKKTLATVYAATLLCVDGGTRPCGRCVSCRQALSGNNPDIINVVHEKTVVSVGDIRLQVNQDIQIKPYAGRYKVFLIDEAEKMNEQAQNALLKTIEEPPGYVKIILITNNYKSFLPTILSRCVLLDFRPVPKDVIKKFLIEKHQVPDYLAEISAAYSGGIVGRAVSYATSEAFISMKEEVVRFLAKLSDDDGDMYDGLGYFIENKKNVDEWLDLIIMWFRDVLVYKATRMDELLLNRPERESIKKQAYMYGYERLNQIINEFDKFKVRIKANVNFDVSLRLLFLSMEAA